MFSIWRARDSRFLYSTVLSKKVDDFLAGRAKGKNIIGTHSIEELVDSLARPRKVMLMIKAGSAVDEMIETLIPLTCTGRYNY